MYNGLIHTQYKTAAGKWYRIRKTDSMEHGTELKRGGEYSAMTTVNNLQCLDLGKLQY